MLRRTRTPSTEGSLPDDIPRPPATAWFPRGNAACGRRGRADRGTEVAAAQVVLRRAGQRAVRQDHRTARVLPDPRRAGDPARNRGRHCPADPGADPDRARLGVFRHDPAPAPRLVAFLGSTIGNLEPGQRAAFLARVRAQLGPDDFFLLGTDLVKDRAALVAAYDDESGVTAEFNKN